MIYLSLYWEFFKIGLFSVGGGMATLPFLYNLAETHPIWFTAKDLADMIAVSESTPGPIGINMATYAGNLTAGPLGGLIATLGEITPSIIIICIVAGFLDAFNTNRYVQDAFYGLRAAVIGLIVYAGSQVFAVTMFSDGMHLKVRETIMFVVLLILAQKFRKVHPLVWILASGLVGILLAL